jgi:hypothetical protein
MANRCRVAPLGVAIALGIVAGAGSIVGCFGATEVDVELTTSVPCEKRVQTQIFTGARGTTDFGAAPAAETAECTTAEPRIGTLSIVPSGALDEAFDLQVVAGVGVAPSTCIPGHRDQCIVARRRATFIKHKALRIPVLLSDRCVGVVCGQDETCDLGLCAKVDDCTDVGCPRERGNAPIDADAAADAPAFIDAPADVVAPDSATGECGPVAETVATGQEIQGQLAMQGADFVYINGSTSAAELRRVPRVGGTPSRLEIKFPVLVAAAASDTEMYYATKPTTALLLTRRALDGTEASTGYGDEANTTLALAGTTLVGITNLMPGINPGPAGFHAFALAGRLDALSAVGDIAVADRTLYVALSYVGSGGAAATGIHRMPRASIAASYNGSAIVPNVTPSTIAAAGPDLYFIDGTTLSRVDLTTASAPVPLTTVGAAPTALAVDAACVYWVEGGTKIMKRAQH